MLIKFLLCTTLLFILGACNKGTRLMKVTSLFSFFTFRFTFIYTLIVYQPSSLQQALLLNRHFFFPIFLILSLLLYVQISLLSASSAQFRTNCAYFIYFLNIILDNSNVYIVLRFSIASQPNIFHFISTSTNFILFPIFFCIFILYQNNLSTSSSFHFISLPIQLISQLNSFPIDVFFFGKDGNRIEWELTISGAMTDYKYLSFVISAYQKVNQLDKGTQLYFCLGQNKISLMILKKQANNTIFAHNAEISLQNYEQLNNQCSGNFQKLTELFKNPNSLKFHYSDFTLKIFKSQSGQLVSTKQLASIQFSKLTKYFSVTNNKTNPNTQDKDNINVQKLQQFIKKSVMNVLQDREIGVQKKPRQNSDTPQNSLKRRQINRRDRIKIDEEDSERSYKKRNWKSRPAYTKKKNDERISKSVESSSSSSEQKSMKRLRQKKMRRAPIDAKDYFQNTQDVVFKSNLITCKNNNGLSLFGTQQLSSSMTLRFQVANQEVFIGIGNYLAQDERFVYGSNGTFYFKIGEEQDEPKNNLKQIHLGQEVIMSFDKRLGKIEWKVRGIVRKRICRQELKQRYGRKWLPIIIFHSMQDRVSVERYN